MKEYYPYTILPQKVEKIRSEGIPLPPLPQLLSLPEKAKLKYLGIVVFAICFVAFIALNLMPVGKYTIYYIYSTFFLSLISLVAGIFEIVQFSRLKKQYEIDLKLYYENKEAFRKIKLQQEKISKNNKNEELVKKYQHEKVVEFFSTAYDTINAVHNAYSLSKKRFKLFLEEYFPDEVLHNVKIYHSAKNLEYVPDFIIKFARPKINVAVEIEEPYSLSNVPENIQKDYDAKDKIRHRFANELGWIVIVLSEEQSVIHPTECCKYIEESIEQIFGELKNIDLFAKIPQIKKQKMLTGEERAHMKSTGYREKYLIEAGLMDEPNGLNDKFDESKNAGIKKEIGEIIKVNVTKKEKDTNLLPETEKIAINVLEKTAENMKTPDEKKESVENEQLALIKKIAQKVKPENGSVQIKTSEHSPIKFKMEEGKEIPEEMILKENKLIPEIKIDETTEKQEVEKLIDESVLQKEEVVENQETKNSNEFKLGEKIEIEALNQEEKQIEKTEQIIEGIDEIQKVDSLSEMDEESDVEDLQEETKIEEKQTIQPEKKEQLRDENDILRDLYQALDKHSRKQQERKEKRLRERMESNGISKSSENIETNEELDIKTKNESFENEEVKSEYPVEELSDAVNLEQQDLLKDQSEDIVENIETTIEQNNDENKSIEAEKIENDMSENKPENEIVPHPLVNIEENPELEVKKQKLTLNFREKIEGAVFDKAWDELILICDEAISELPLWDWAYYRRSTAWGNRREFEKVIEDCTKAVGLNPALADAYYNRATAYFFTGKYREAADDYQKAIDMNSIKRGEAYFNRGLCFQKMDYHKKAYLEFMKAKEMGNKKAEEVLRNQYE